MFAKLRGLVDTIQCFTNESWVIIDVHGVGYQIFCSEKTLQTLPPLGDSATLFIETHVREDRIQLFGFASEDEKAWFRILTGVQGVGAKVALSLLSCFAPQHIAQIIVAQDKNLLTRADGVGPKLASRLVTELKDQAAAFAPLGPTIIQLNPSKSAPITVSTAESAPTLLHDAISALVNLGYNRSEAYHIVARFYHEQPDIALPDLIRLSLRELRL